MGFRFQRRIRIAPGVRLNLSKSGAGVGLGRKGLRIGLDAKRRRYFSIGLPGTGLSYRAFFGPPVTRQALKRVLVIVTGTLLCLGILITAVIELRS